METRSDEMKSSCSITHIDQTTVTLADRKIFWTNLFLQLWNITTLIGTWRKILVNWNDEHWCLTDTKKIYSPWLSSQNSTVIYLDENLTQEWTILLIGNIITPLFTFHKKKLIEILKFRGLPLIVIIYPSIIFFLNK